MVKIRGIDMCQDVSELQAHTQVVIEESPVMNTQIYKFEVIGIVESIEKTVRCTRTRRQNVACAQPMLSLATSWHCK